MTTGIGAAMAPGAPHDAKRGGTPLALSLLAAGGCVLVFVLTLVTLSVATTCNAPLHEGGLSSAPVTKLGVAARLGALLRRVTGEGSGGSAGAGAASAGDDVGYEHTLTSAELLPLKARAQQLQALISADDSEGARAGARRGHCAAHGGRHPARHQA